MSDDTQVVNSTYLLEKKSGKGGWTYAAIPEISPNRKAPFGWVKVRGSIDDYPINHYKLMPMGEGKLFLPVKVAIRKKIGKEAGDRVRVVLYLDDTSIEIPAEITACFENESTIVQEKFLALTEGEKKSYLDWIYGAKTEETKVKRIISMIKQIEKS